MCRISFKVRHWSHSFSSKLILGTHTPFRTCYCLIVPRTYAQERSSNLYLMVTTLSSQKYGRPFWCKVADDNDLATLRMHSAPEQRSNLPTRLSMVAV